MIINGNAQSLPLADCSVDTVCTDPPYELGFMGKRWDASGVAFDPATWAESLRVAKPGATLLAFGGTRTWHRLACAIEDARWIIRDCLMYMYGSGFPKSHDISKAIDKAAGAEREVVGSGYRTHTNSTLSRAKQAEHGYRPNGPDYPCDSPEYDITAPATPLAQLWDGYGTALAPSWEPIIVAMKPLDGTFAANAEKHGVAGLWIDGGRIGTSKNTPASPSRTGQWFGAGHETGHETGHDPNIGRWPANVLLDEHAAGLLDEQSGERGVSKKGSGVGNKESMFGLKNQPGNMGLGDSGGASRFFYVSKPSRAERDAGCYALEPRSGGDITGRKAGSAGAKASAYAGTTEAVRRNPHPTVKPVALMRYLVRLTRTPTGGVVLDPFCGSGTTGMACELEDRDFVGVDLNPDYCELARARIAHVQKHGTDWKADPRQVALDAQMDLLK